MSDLHPLPSENDTLHVGKLTSFSHPDDVLADHDLTIPEKRRLLASWVSDANSVPHMPTLRQLPDGSVVKAEDILRALGTLDASDTSRSLSWRAPFQRRRGWILRNAHRRGRGPDDDGPTAKSRSCDAPSARRGRRGVRQCAGSASLTDRSQLRREP